MTEGTRSLVGRRSASSRYILEQTQRRDPGLRLVASRGNSFGGSRPGGQPKASNLRIVTPSPLLPPVDSNASARGHRVGHLEGSIASPPA